jgi:hypothetical protein
MNIHEQKIELLAKLVKEDKITLDQALLLLKDSNEEKSNVPASDPASIPPYINGGRYWYDRGSTNWSLRFNDDIN